MFQRKRATSADDTTENPSHRPRAPPMSAPKRDNWLTKNTNIVNIISFVHVMISHYLYQCRFWWIRVSLTHKQLETHGCVLSTVATDGLVLKHRAISIHRSDWIFIILDQFHSEIFWSCGTISKDKIMIKKYPFFALTRLLYGWRVCHQITKAIRKCGSLTDIITGSCVNS